MSKDSQFDWVGEDTAKVEPAGPMPVTPPIATPDAVDPSVATQEQAANFHSPEGTYIQIDKGGVWRRMELVDGKWVPVEGNWYQRAFKRLSNRQGFKDSISRAINTFVQAIIATAGVSTLANGIEDVHWLRVLSVASLAAVLSILQSVRRYTKTDDTDE